MRENDRTIELPSFARSKAFLDVVREMRNWEPFYVRGAAHAALNWTAEQFDQAMREEGLILRYPGNE